MFEINSRHISKRLGGTVLFVGLVVVCSSTINVGQTPPPEIPDFAPTVSFSDCLNGLKDESIKSMFDRNRELIKVVDEHGVGFQLSTNTRDVLTKAGASDGLLWSISRGQKKRSDEIIRLMRLYQADHGNSDIEALSYCLANQKTGHMCFLENWAVAVLAKFGC